MRLVFSFNRLVRMPFTPLAHDRLFLQEAEWEPLVREARDAVETVGEFRLASSWPEYAASQVLALGGYWLHEPLEALAGAGLCFDRELPAAAWTVLERWLREHPREAAELAAEKAPDHPYPLGFVRTPVRAEARYAQYLRARESLARGQPDRSPLDLPAPRLTAEAPAAMTELMRRKARLKPVYLVLEVPREAAGGSPEWLEAWMLRRLLDRHPALAENLLSVRETLFAGLGPRERFPPGTAAPCSPSPPGSRRRWPRCRPRCRPRSAAPGFRRVAEMRLRLELPERFFPRAAERLAQYLAAEHAPATIRRAGEDLLLQSGPRALKRKVLLAGVVRAAGDTTIAELTVGPRFRLRRYLAIFPEPEAWRRALVEVDFTAGAH